MSYKILWLVRNDIEEIGEWHDRISSICDLYEKAGARILTVAFTENAQARIVLSDPRPEEVKLP